MISPAMLLLLGLLAPAPPPREAPDITGYEGSICTPGFCPVPTRRGPPPGLMYLSVGLIGIGAAGLWPRKLRVDCHW
jgi:hypothetical protein